MKSIDTIVLGCIIGVISSAMSSVGITLQRRSHIIEDGRPPGSPRRPAHKQGLWRIGLLMFLASNVFGSSVQITTLPIVVLSPLQAVGLVFNSICASVILSEPFTKFSLIGTVLVSIGALLIASFGAVPEPQHNLDELLKLLHRKSFLIWMACTMVVVGLVYLCIRLKDWYDERADQYYMEGSRPMHYNYSSPSVKGILYGVISGILSAHSLLMAKSAVELIVRGISDRHWSDYFRWQSWLIVCAFLFFALSQLYVLNCGLRLCSTSVLYPLVFCVFNITAILNGLIYFKQTSRLSAKQIALVAFGTSLVLVGVLSLSWRLDKSTMQSYSAVMHEQSQQQGVARRSSRHTSSEDGLLGERQPLLVNTALDDDSDDADAHQIAEYTSFRSLTPSGAAVVTANPNEPTSPFSAAGNRNVKVRTLSLEQSDILEQMRKRETR